MKRKRKEEREKLSAGVSAARIANEFAPTGAGQAKQALKASVRAGRSRFLPMKTREARRECFRRRRGSSAKIRRGQDRSRRVSRERRERDAKLGGGPRKTRKKAEGAEGDSIWKSGNQERRWTTKGTGYTEEIRRGRQIGFFGHKKHEGAAAADGNCRAPIGAMGAWTEWENSLCFSRQKFRSLDGQRKERSDFFSHKKHEGVAAA